MEEVLSSVLDTLSKHNGRLDKLKKSIDSKANPTDIDKEVKRIAKEVSLQLEAKVAKIQVPKDGRDGRDGKDGSQGSVDYKLVEKFIVDDIAKYAKEVNVTIPKEIKKYVDSKNYTGPQGPKGDTGSDGKSIVGPAGKDGKPGKDGKDGKSVSKAEIDKMISARVKGMKFSDKKKDEGNTNFAVVPNPVAVTALRNLSDVNAKRPNEGDTLVFKSGKWTAVSSSGTSDDVYEVVTTSTVASLQYTLVNASSNIDVTLPANEEGKVITIKRIDTSSNTVTVVGTIDGTTGNTLGSGEAFKLLSTDVAWYIV